MGKLRDELIRTGTPAPWLMGVPDTAGSIRRELKSHVQGKSRGLPDPYRKPQPGVTEAGILRATKELLTKLRIMHRRIDCNGKIVNTAQGPILAPGSHTGLPDIIGCLSGAFLALELKRPGARVSPIQMSTLFELQTAGARVAIVVNPAKLDSWLKTGVSTCTLENIPVV